MATIAPFQQTISRDDGAAESEIEMEDIKISDDNDDDFRIVVETLTKKHFLRVLEIENEFFGTTGKGMCFGLVPLQWFPKTLKEFEAVYKDHPDRCKTYGVAILKRAGENDKIVGTACLRDRSQYASWEEGFMHKCSKGELHVDHLAVSSGARGMGAGTLLLQWAETKAKERQCTKLTLEVVYGNPAKRLYDRFGFHDVGSSWCMAGCLVGRPHGQIGATEMEKRIIQLDELYVTDK